jgi:hypothetical protein
MTKKDQPRRLKGDPLEGKTELKEEETETHAASTLHPSGRVSEDLPLDFLVPWW